MQKKQSEAVAALSVAAGIVGAALFVAVKTELRERKIRKEIDKKTEAEISRIDRAGKMVIDEIDRGLYDNRFYDVWPTFEYYKHVLEQEES